MNNLIDLTGKKIVITGASSGIGRAVAMILADLGAQCILIARREERLKEVMVRLSNLHGGHRYYVFDLENVGLIEQLIKEIVRDIGPLDGMAYCAGIPGTQPIKVNKLAYMQHIMRVNFYAYYEMIRCMVQRGNYSNPCRIVGISSVAAPCPAKAQSAYSASKAAMDAATRGLAVELHSKGVYLNTVRPGCIDTEMHQSFHEGTGIDPMDPIRDRQFMGIGQPEDVAGLVAYLLSPASKFMTGVNIAVDGGYTCH